jgi:hypothetical protein
MHIRLQPENLKEIDHLEDLGIVGKIILGSILEKYGAKLWIGFVCLRIGSMAGSCEHGNESSGSIKGEKFLDWVIDCQLFKKDCASCSYFTPHKSSVSRFIYIISHSCF